MVQLKYFDGHGRLRPVADYLAARDYLERFSSSSPKDSKASTVQGDNFVCADIVAKQNDRGLRKIHRRI